MVLDNKKIVLQINKLRYIFLLSFSTILVLIIFSGFFDTPVLGIERNYYIIAIIFLYLAYNIIKYILNYNYFYYNDDGNKLIFRFVSLRPFDNQKRAIEIPKKDFKGYTTKTFLFNFKEDIILKTKTQRGVASYPPISISALSLKHKNLLKNALNQYL